MALKETLKQKIEEFRPRTTRLTKEFGKVVIDQVTIDQAIGGARDIRSLVTDISYLDPQEGIRFRGKTIPETFAALPKAPGSKYPTVESFWYFLLTGDVPTQAQVDEVVAEWKVRQAVPEYVSLLSAPCRVTAIRWSCFPSVSLHCRKTPSLPVSTTPASSTRWSPGNMCMKMPADIVARIADHCRLHLQPQVSAVTSRSPSIRNWTWAPTLPI